MYVCAPCSRRSPQKSQKDTGAPGAGVTSGCASLCGCRERNQVSVKCRTILSPGTIFPSPFCSPFWGLENKTKPEQHLLSQYFLKLIGFKTTDRVRLFPLLLFSESLNHLINQLYCRTFRSSIGSSHPGIHPHSLMGLVHWYRSHCTVSPSVDILFISDCDLPRKGSRPHWFVLLTIEEADNSYVEKSLGKLFKLQVLQMCSLSDF